ncbi:MAG TPA: hypothetical protein VJ972_02170 [Anaerolineales bacterium]|nr:hypothetical protein [Anaerolineales bacterium]
MKIKTTSFIRISLSLPYILCGIGYLFSLSDNFGAADLSDILVQQGILWLIVRFLYEYYFYWLPPYTLVIALWLLWSRKKPKYKMIPAAVLLPLIFTPFMIVWMGLDLIDLIKGSAEKISEVAVGLALVTGLAGIFVAPIIIICGYLFVLFAAVIYYLLKIVNIIDNESTE